MLNSQFSNLYYIKLPLIFLAGSLNSLTPCSISIFPAVVYSLQDIKLSKQYIKWLFFTLGIYTSFLFFFLLNKVLYLPTANLQSIIIITVNFILGLIAIEIFPSFTYYNSFNFLKNLNSDQFIFLSYFSGVGLGLTISSCSTPILFTLLNWLNSQQNILQEMLYGWVYSIGYSFPILLVTIVFKNLLQIFNNNIISSLFGISLIGISVYSMLSIITVRGV
uniref:cytochrome c biogenesis protein transmembrane region n=1 Tax=Rhodaphanes brevistipitata TaxID=446136 RepID=UPI001FCDB23B|nr:cytochrome c biogenesis protein transmembrane region [Rhodaphanes brevistipitata]UNJ18484.1 cytochrome c biogenesis protein transmembrane region [Rhodaphanes brevistipitata]